LSEKQKHKQRKSYLFLKPKSTFLPEENTKYSSIVCAQKNASFGKTHFLKEIVHNIHLKIKIFNIKRMGTPL